MFGYGVLPFLPFCRFCRFCRFCLGPTLCENHSNAVYARAIGWQTPSNSDDYAARNCIGGGQRTAEIAELQRVLSVGVLADKNVAALEVAVHNGLGEGK